MTLQKRLPRPVKRVCTARRAGAFGPDRAGRLRSIDRVKVKLPDGNELELEKGATGADAAAAIGPGLARAALAVRHDGELRDLSAPLADGTALEILTDSAGDDALELIRHDAAHVLAEAVSELYPGVKVSIGPAIENGFYYDFEFPEGVTVTEDDLPAIQERMEEHIRAGEGFERREVGTDEAIEIFRGEGQDYKVELIEDLVRDEGVQTVSLYRNGGFTDLCRGPHGPGTDRIGAVHLQSVAGAYWRGDSDRTMLTRIYGTAFFDRKALDAELERLEQELRPLELAEILVRRDQRRRVAEERLPHLLELGVELLELERTARLGLALAEAGLAGTRLGGDGLGDERGEGRDGDGHQAGEPRWDRPARSGVTGYRLGPGGGHRVFFLRSPGREAGRRRRPRSRRA